MKKLFLCSSFADVEDLFLKFIGEGCSGRSVTFIPTASLREEVNFYVSAAKEVLERHGLVVDELDVSTTESEQIESKLRSNDYIYVSGGNTFFLLQALKRTGADKVLAEQINTGKIYIGESAGSVLLSRDIEYVKELDDAAVAPGLESFSSLGMVEFYPLPHYKSFPFEDSVENIISRYRAMLNLCPIRNTQAIIVNGNKFEVWGGEA